MPVCMPQRRITEQKIFTPPAKVIFPFDKNNASLGHEIEQSAEAGRGIIDWEMSAS